MIQSSAVAFIDKQNGDTMKYSIQYQYRPKGKIRPNDDGELVPIMVNDETILPNIGDHVHIGATGSGKSGLSGIVASRFFYYQQISSGEVFCSVNIVLDECDDDVWSTLIKE